MSIYPSPTLDQIDAICARLRVGAFEQVAVESAGVDWGAYQTWIKQSRQADCKPEYTLLADSVRQAKADARLSSEMDVRKSEPRTWLIYGPARQSATQDGWGLPDKSAAGSPGAVHSEVVELAAVILSALNEEPTARAKAANAVDPLKTPGTF